MNRDGQNVIVHRSSSTLNFFLTTHYTPAIIQVNMKYMSTVDATITYDGFATASASIEDNGGYERVRFSLSETNLDLTKRPDPVHVALANVTAIELTTGQPTVMPVPTRAQAAALARFVKMYGSVTHSHLLHEVADPSESFSEDPVMFAKMQCVLRAAWQGDTEALSLIAAEEYGWRRWAVFIQEKARQANVKWHHRDAGTRWDPAEAVHARLGIRESGIELVAGDLWSLARLLFLADGAKGRLGVCANENCATPYFVLPRRGRRFCSHPCALASASRHYRRRVKQVLEKERKEGRWPKKS